MSADVIHLFGPYDAELVRKAASSNLVVVFSHSVKHALRRYQYHHNVLFLKERKPRYFLPHAGKACRSLIDEINRLGFDQVIFVGSSKGGFGAILWASLCAKIDRYRTYRALAFSPQTRLWPRNKRLYFPSYRAVYFRRGDHAAQSALRKYGDLGYVADRANLDVTVIFGRENEVDAAEAAALRGCNVEHIAVPLAIHGSLVPFSIDRSDRSAVVATVQKMYANAKVDEDLKATLPSNPDDLIKAIISFEGPESLNALISERITRLPRGPSFWQRVWKVMVNYRLCLILAKPLSSPTRQDI